MATIHAHVETYLDGDPVHSYTVKWFDADGRRLDAFFTTRQDAEAYARSLADELPRATGELRLTNAAAEAARARSRRRRGRAPLAAFSSRWQH